MKKQRQGVTESQILQILSNKISLDIFYEIARNPITSDNLRRTIGITNKQFYSRYSELIKAGLVKRKLNANSLTAFGKVIYHAQTKITRASQRNSVLNAIDALIANTAIPTQERQEVIDKLIDDSELKRVVLLSIR
jgi:DNA-binding HxlR family transcriptional regulator